MSLFLRCGVSIRRCRQYFSSAALAENPSATPVCENLPNVADTSKFGEKPREDKPLVDFNPPLYQYHNIVEHHSRYLLNLKPSFLFIQAKFLVTKEAYDVCIPCSFSITIQANPPDTKYLSAEELEKRLLHLNSSKVLPIKTYLEYKTYLYMLSTMPGKTSKLMVEMIDFLKAKLPNYYLLDPEVSQWLMKKIACEVPIKALMPAMSDIFYYVEGIIWKKLGPGAVSSNTRALATLSELKKSLEMTVKFNGKSFLYDSGDADPDYLKSLSIFSSMFMNQIKGCHPIDPELVPLVFNRLASLGSLRANLLHYIQYVDELCATYNRSVSPIFQKTEESLIAIFRYLSLRKLYREITFSFELFSKANMGFSLSSRIHSFNLLGHAMISSPSDFEYVFHESISKHPSSLLLFMTAIRVFILKGEFSFAQKYFLSCKPLISALPSDQQTSFMSQIFSAIPLAPPLRAIEEFKINIWPYLCDFTKRSADGSYIFVPENPKFSAIFLVIYAKVLPQIFHVVVKQYLDQDATYLNRSDLLPIVLNSCIRDIGKATPLITKDLINMIINRWPFNNGPPKTRLEGSSKILSAGSSIHVEEAGQYKELKFLAEQVMLFMLNFAKSRPAYADILILLSAFKKHIEIIFPFCTDLEPGALVEKRNMTVLRFWLLYLYRSEQPLVLANFFRTFKSFILFRLQDIDQALLLPYGISGKSQRIFSAYQITEKYSRQERQLIISLELLKYANNFLWALAKDYDWRNFLDLMTYCRDQNIKFLSYFEAFYSKNQKYVEEAIMLKLPANSVDLAELDFPGNAPVGYLPTKATLGVIKELKNLGVVTCGNFRDFLCNDHQAYLKGPLRPHIAEFSFLERRLNPSNPIEKIDKPSIEIDYSFSPM